jgi:RNA polymerase sigma factor (sigma-70 family)
VTSSASDGDGDDPLARKCGFEDLYRQEHHRLRQFAAYMGPDLDWESAVQDAFVEALKKWDEIHTSKKAWLRQVVKNRLADQRRRRERPAEAGEEFANLLNGVRIQSPRLGDAEMCLELKETFAAIHALPEQHRHALVLRFIGLADDEIAQDLDVDLRTVQRYISSALRGITEEAGNPERRLSARRQLQRRSANPGTPPHRRVES